MSGAFEVRVPRIELPRVTFAAEEAFQILKSRIEKLESELDSEHELAIEWGDGAQLLYAERFGCVGRHLLWFRGTTADGSKAELYQHVSQLRVLFVAAKKVSATARRIGFEPTAPDDA